MGGDGGSIPDRSDLVRTRGKAQVADKRSQLVAVWCFCALSKKPLEPPLVSCPLGRLYNKDAALEFLLSPPEDASDQRLVFLHIRSHKDLVTLSLTPNPNYSNRSATKAQGEDVLSSARWICPISMREMNGAVKFVYNRPCGCVLSELAMREMGESAKETCPVCNVALTSGPTTLNPVGEEKERMAAEWEEKKAKEREEKLAKKGDKKRKKDKLSDESSAAATPAATSGDDQDRPVAKKLREADGYKRERQTIRPPPPKFTIPIPEKKPVSAAVASLYASKQPKVLKATVGAEWMVQGTFHRHA